MAAPITHIVLADKVFNKFFSDKKKKDFFIGTVFPDIRYLGVMDRKSTHFPLRKLNLEDVKKEQNSFTAGLKFHSIVDGIRTGFMKSKKIYSLCPDSKYSSIALKVVEDELYYDRINNWNEFIGFLDGILPEELSFGTQEKHIKKWHRMLQDYFLKKPDEKSNRKFGEGLGFSKDAGDEINNLMSQIRSDEEIKKIIKEFYSNFESFLV